MEPVVDALAAQAPNWEPGTAHGYHLRSFGWLVGEIVRRVDGRTIGRLFAEEIAAPLGLDFWIGLPEVEEPRVATLVPPPPGFARLIRGLPDDLLLGKATTGPSGLFMYDEMWNRRELRACELPSSNGVGDARSVARLYASLLGAVDGVRTLQPATVAAASACQVRGPDRVILIDTRSVSVSCCRPRFRRRRGSARSGTAVPAGRSRSPIPMPISRSRT